MAATEKFIELKDPKTGETVRIEPKVSIIQFLSTFRYWFVSAFVLGHKILGSVGVACIVLAILCATDDDWKSFVIPVALIYVALGSYFALNIREMTARSFLRRGWIISSGEMESVSKSRPKLKAALLVGGIIIAILLFALVKSFMTLSDADAAAASGAFAPGPGSHE